LVEVLLDDVKTSSVEENSMEKVVTLDGTAQVLSSFQNTGMEEVLEVVTAGALQDQSLEEEASANVDDHGSCSFETLSVNACGGDDDGGDDGQKWDYNCASYHLENSGP